MGNALSIAAVSRVLRQVIEGNVTRYGLDGYVDDDVAVTAEPPIDDLTRTRINLFLYRAGENGQLRNRQQPAYDHQGRPVNRPTLSLELNYALTAYADGDFQSEMMLGCAMQAFLETPVLNRALILEILSQDPGANTLLDSRLAEQIENIRIRHRNVPEDTLTRIWSSFHLPYRLSAFYEVSVVLIESDLELRTSTPVLIRPEPRAHANLGPVTSTIFHASPETAVAGETVTLTGVRLTGDNLRVEADNRASSDPVPAVDIPPTDASDTQVTFTVPTTWPIGRYDLRVTLEPTGGGDRRPSNAIAFSVAPSITIDNVTRDAAPPQHVTIELTVAPAIQPAQPATLIVGSRSFNHPAILAETTSLTFTDLDIPAGSTAAHLRVDGIDSPWIDRDATPPSILPGAMITIP